MRTKTLSRRMKYITSEIVREAVGDADVFEVGNIVMLCAFISTLASLALYAFCVYCI